MGFPLELITMLGSTLLGGVMSFMGQAMKNKAEQQKMLMERATLMLSKLTQHVTQVRRIATSHGHAD